MFGAPTLRRRPSGRNVDLTGEASSADTQDVKVPATCLSLGSCTDEADATGIFVQLTGGTGVCFVNDYQLGTGPQEIVSSSV